MPIVHLHARFVRDNPLWRKSRAVRAWLGSGKAGLARPVLSVNQ